jgi:hypothetical protein
MTARKTVAWNDGHDRLRLSEMYAGRPQDGIVFYVEQRAAGAGRAVLLAPGHVAEVIAWLTARMQEAAGQRPYGAPRSQSEQSQDAAALPVSPYGTSHEMRQATGGAS